MRLLIDLQAAQGCNKDRGIGRYALALAKALLAEARGHEVWIALNEAFGETIEPLRATFDTLLPQERIVVWKAPVPAAGADPRNGWRCEVGEILRESFFDSLAPDIVHVPSLFEGISDDALASVGRIADGTGTAVTIHDLIPLFNRDHYLADATIDSAYQRKITSLRRAGLWLPVSQWSRHDAIERLDLPAEKLVVVPNAADSRFRPLRLTDHEAEAFLGRFGIRRPFVMCTGGADPRKNVERLIGAFARLPSSVRARHQLVLVYAADTEEVRALSQHAGRAGLARDEFILTGFVSDDDLVQLYNLCRSFCFPSLMEGFGLPVLEAMQCGAPVIGADAAAIPEVIDNPDALFDPSDEEAMCARLHQVLTDDNYRDSLVAHGSERARRYNWQDSARTAWAAFEAHRAEMKPWPARQLPAMVTRIPRLAYVSPLPPERSGISDYSVELLPELARYYDIDVIAAEPPVANSWVNANCPTRSIAWFGKNSHLYDRILYHFGNSVFHRHMFDLLEKHPGVIVLHDVYLSGIIAHMDRNEGKFGYWAQALYRSHGYGAVEELDHAADAAAVVWKYPANLPVLQAALGVVVHSEFARSLAARDYGDEFVADWAVLRQPFRVPPGLAREPARAALGFAEGDFVVCSVGVIGPAKLAHRLLEAWIGSDFARGPGCHLVFVGQDPDGSYAGQLRRMAASSPGRIRLTGFTTPEVYRQYLAAADAAVQLRTLSRGETSRAVLDCMASGLPTIVNAHGALAALPEDCVIKLADQFDDEALVAAIKKVHRDVAFRVRCGARARAYVAASHSPRRAAEHLHAAIERFTLLGHEARKARAISALVRVEHAPAAEQEWLAVARAMHRNVPPRPARRQLLVDVSELVQRDVGTGVQRVVRSLLAELFNRPPPGYRIEPVWAIEARSGYRYGREFALRFLGCAGGELHDAPVDFRQGDLFLGLDLQPHVVPSQAAAFAEMRRLGVEIYFVVHDLLPILMPGFFATGAAEIHEKWLSTITTYADGLISVSRSVADEVIRWLDGARVPRARPLRIGWIHHGADLPRANAAIGAPENAQNWPLSEISLPSFLMVGTLEPRKGHAQALAAFERLWASGVQACLVVVGRQGWMVETLAKRLRSHPEFGRRLSWLEEVSDQHLDAIYRTCSCLLAASAGEGFGLPLVEAARHGLAILARDIPVFREVAGAHASYFRGDTPEELARALQDWLLSFAAGTHVRSCHMPSLTWTESAEQLKALLFGNRWYARWPEDAGHNCAADDRLAAG